MEPRYQLSKEEEERGKGSGREKGNGEFLASLTIFSDKEGATDWSGAGCNEGDDDRGLWAATSEVPKSYKTNKEIMLMDRFMRYDSGIFTMRTSRNTSKDTRSPIRIRVGVGGLADVINASKDITSPVIEVGPIPWQTDSY